jgi:hypothetical protein
MSGHGERLGLGRRFRLAGGVLAVVSCLAVTSCSAASSSPGGASAQSSTSTGSALDTSAALGAGLGAPGYGSLSTAAPRPAGPPADPFAGTPADDWADGAAGIALPAAAPADGYTAAQVGSAYQATRKLLIAANLDRQTLLGGPPTAFADLLTSQDRASFLSGLNDKGVDAAGYSLSTRSMVMSFAPGSTQLVGNVIKAHGTMSVSKHGSVNNALGIDVDFLFVYAIEPPGQPRDWMRVVDETSWQVSFGDWHGAATSFEPWVTSNGASGTSGTKCGSLDGYSHPDYPVSAVAAPRPTVTPSGPSIDPYVPGQRPAGSCVPTTGT